MALPAGTRLGPYEILEPLGAGGMGEVYRARDTRLERNVAVKILPAELSQDAARLHRFEQEARAAGALNHPNVLVVLDVGSHGGRHYVVSELLEGRTLRERLGGEALPPRKVIEYGAQLARGLAAAHGKGIVHRDFKPENLFVTQGGLVKILDFGLAKVVRPASVDREAETETEATEPGVVLGTAGYQPPEQVRGQDVDARSDIFALGAVLYEMLTGERAFRGPTVADTVTAILAQDPQEMSQPGRVIPPGLERVVRRCLEKDPEERFQSARDVAFALEAESGAARPTLQAVAAVPRHRRWLRGSLVALALLAVGVGIGLLAGRGVSERATTRATIVDIALPPGVQFVEPAYARLSSDGRQLLFVGLDRGGRRLWVRTLDSPVAHPVPGGERGWPVTWSLDGRRVTFASDDSLLKELDVATGAVRTLGRLPKGLPDTSGSWNRTGDLLISWGSILHFPASGGGPMTAMRPDGRHGELALDAPQFLPDGRHYLFSALGVTPEQSGVYIAALGSERRLLLRSISWAAFATQGYLIFRRDTRLFAQRFDPSRLQLSGDPKQLVDHVYVSIWRHPTAWVAGDTLAFVTGDPLRYRLSWRDRRGRDAGHVGQPAEIVTWDLSPDGTRVVAQVGYPGSLWLMDTARGTSKRLTQAGDDADPRFGADGKAVLFDRGGSAPGLYRLSLDGGRLVALPRQSGRPDQARPFVSDWSRDGRVALYAPGASTGLWSFPVAGDGPPRPVVESAGTVDEARLSPDGRWVAYDGDETGRMEVFVVPFPPTGERWQVSNAGGVQPLWRGDGRELYYLDPDGAVMSVDVNTTPTFSTSPPRILFHSGIEDPSGFIEDYDVTDDGQRFVFRLPVEDARPRQLQLVLHWPALLGEQASGQTVQ